MKKAKAEAIESVNRTAVGCFVAGTLVHTKEGLVPIEEIKVGDWVLSKPESGLGDLTYKQVINTFEFDDKEVWYINYEVIEDAKRGEQPRSEFVVVTGNHPFWIVGTREYSPEDKSFFVSENGFARWVRADALDDILPNGVNPVLLLSDGTLAQVVDASPLLEMASTNRGMIRDYAFNDVRTGHIFDFSGNAPNQISRFPDRSVPIDREEDEEGEFPVLKRRVYNIEVDENHTYFVGVFGAWVHNTNCSFAGESLVSQQREQGVIQIYQGRAEFAASLAGTENKGIGLIREQRVT